MQNVILYKSISFENTKKYAAFWGDLFLIALSYGKSVGNAIRNKWLWPRGQKLILLHFKMG